MSSPLLCPDFCTSLKITDQSNQNVLCNIFCEKLEDHPIIFQIGDIIRLHRVKVGPRFQNCLDHHLTRPTDLPGCWFSS